MSFAVFAPFRELCSRIHADRELYQRQIEATNRLTDRVVYPLYGLTDEEVAIVEGSAS